MASGLLSGCEGCDVVDGTTQLLEVREIFFVVERHSPAADGDGLLGAVRFYIFRGFPRECNWIHRLFVD